MFSVNEDDLGYTKTVTHKIPTVDQVPIKVPHRSIPPNIREEVRQHIKKLLRQKVIHPSTSPYAAPVVLVRNSDNTLRICVDYRQLNAKTVKDAYQLPRIQDALDTLKGTKYFSSLDLTQENHQMAVDNADIHKTAFRIGCHGLYEYMNMSEWPFDPDKTKVIDNWKEPESKKELRSFLGIASYYRRFVPKFATIAAPLHDLLGSTVSKKRKKKSEANPDEKKPFKDRWNADCIKAFKDLKIKLVSSPILGYPDFSLPFILETDASQNGLGAVISQKQPDGHVVIAYASRALRPAEKNMSNYSTMKLELLAMKWAITDIFRDYLLGSKFVVYTDNNPLSYLQSALGMTELRWASQLAQFDFEIKYRSEKENCNADSLSRKPSNVESAETYFVQLVNSSKIPFSTRIPGIAYVNSNFIETASPCETFPSFTKQQLVDFQTSDPVIGRLV